MTGEWRVPSLRLGWRATDSNHKLRRKSQWPTRPRSAINWNDERTAELKEVGRSAVRGPKRTGEKDKPQPNNRNSQAEPSVLSEKMAEQPHPHREKRQLSIGSE